MGTEKKIVAGRVKELVEQILAHTKKPKAFVNMEGEDQDCECVKLSKGRYKVNFDNEIHNYIPVLTIVQAFGTRDDIKSSVIDGSIASTGFEFMIHEGDNGTSADKLIDAKIMVTVV